MRRLTAVEALYFCEHIRDLAVCSTDVSVPLLIRWLGISTFFFILRWCLSAVWNNMIAAAVLI